MIKASKKYKFEDYGKRGRQFGDENKYPWKNMDIGESFPTSCQGASAAAQANKASIRYAPRCFAYRTTEDGPRIFRVK